MASVVSILTFVAVLFFGMLAMIELGRRLRVRQHAMRAEGADLGLGTVEGAVFALLGLLIAFTFSGAASRFDARRQLIVEEANDIGTAYLRLDLLPPITQAPLREKFRDYVDARLGSTRGIPGSQGARAEHIRALGLQTEIWRDAVSASQNPPPRRRRCFFYPP